MQKFTDSHKLSAYVHEEQVAGVHIFKVKVSPAFVTDTEVE